MQSVSYRTDNASRTDAEAPRGYLIKVNRHIQRFDGTICRNATAVHCGASETFRANKCARGRAECYDMHLFDADGMQIQRRLNYSGSELIKDIRDGDYLLFWTYQTHGPWNQNQNPIFCGLYVADSIDVESNFTEPTYTIYPRGMRGFT